MRPRAAVTPTTPMVSVVRSSQLHVLDGNREVIAEKFDRNLIFLVKAVGEFTLHAQDADQFAAREQRNAQQTFRARHPR